ncbi:ABC-type branched-subunit amino acid transport system substrate-binding protein [Prauserella isguenensis]|uniref:ABC-type branched-subunit amino acid transport system substrate-binding protein n=1 Tax=Prauserella isguenensis TaxID=1470180 RepID=A0A839S6M9_9PSEU|nr:ABC-type branched-subunit amino acid transport system substrate-binding protein [Prauserella isguenensis]
MRRTLAIACAAALVLTACGTKGGGSDGGTEGAGGVTTDVGVTDADITLGVMTDQTGPFKALSTGITHGNQLWVEDANADGGICGRDLKLEIVDHGYKADTPKTLYPQIEPKVLGLVQLVGSPVTAR